jgi:hypothetical protein
MGRTDGLEAHRRLRQGGDGMKGMGHWLFWIALLAFLLGVVVNILQLFLGPEFSLLWAPLTWWRGAMGAGLFAMILALWDIQRALAARG